ncbi:hypothetical protein MTX35_06985 [Rhodococcus sp. ARC_M12]|uniref:hypothetical protein n=1 Tax=Rhodococcus sp. ARC_M12 TaxID=2928854 RepID=UPI001FB40065|nr:hypothetical protein [Rhodococcus sp. ARC_M12]MCJ0977438.1 hypothetical protein [Rhodococcus sp. ARC_M12]
MGVDDRNDFGGAHSGGGQRQVAPSSAADHINTELFDAVNAGRTTDWGLVPVRSHRRVAGRESRVDRGRHSPTFEPGAAAP